VYSDERTPDLETNIDGLKELICQYIAAHAEFTSRDTTFTALIEEGGSCAGSMEACGTKSRFKLNIAINLWVLCRDEQI
jgi:hypothetical protein